MRATKCITELTKHVLEIRALIDGLRVGLAGGLVVGR